MVDICIFVLAAAAKHSQPTNKYIYMEREREAVDASNFIGVACRGSRRLLPTLLIVCSANAIPSIAMGTRVCVCVHLSACMQLWLTT